MEFSYMTTWLISNGAVVTTILQFLSGVMVCKQYVANNTTAEASPLPFLFGVISTGVWLLYGLTIQDYKIVTVNIVGLVLNISYVIVFYKYTFKKSSLLKQICCCLMFLVVVIGYHVTEEDNEILMIRLGISACVLTVITIAAPMSKLLYVIKHKNTACLPFPLIVMSFFVSTQWLMYGIIKEDLFIIVPNSLGVFLGVSQLCLFIKYPSRPLSQTQAKSLIA